MTHLILTKKQVPHLAVLTEDGWLTNSGIINDEEIGTICPINEIGKRIKRIGQGDRIYNTNLKIIGIVENNKIIYPFSIRIKEEVHYYNLEKGFIASKQYPEIIHYSEAERRGLVDSEKDIIEFNNNKINN